jgi:hypothetical protein
MLRREFLAGSIALLLSDSLKRTTALSIPCTEDASDHTPNIKLEANEDYATFLAAKYPEPGLTTILPFTVTLTDWRHGHFFASWNDERKAKVIYAAKLFQKVWSSQEFRRKVMAVPTFVWHQDTKHEDRNPEHITGADLYPKLVSAPNITMKLTIIQDARRQTASSGLDFTEIEQKWIDNKTVYDLANTLSHEYTHYAVPGWSWDEGHAGPLRNYVSYGIGGITENLAAGWVRCCDDPTTPPPL